MERTLLTSPATPFFPKIAIRSFQLNVQYGRDQNHLHERIQKDILISSALPETAVSVVVTAIAVGAAATLLARRTKASDTLESSTKTCEDCEGSGICAECKGEGFVLKKLSEESADRARKVAKKHGNSLYSRASKEVELLFQVFFISILSNMWWYWASDLCIDGTIAQHCAGPLQTK